MLAHPWTGLRLRTCGAFVREPVLYCSCTHAPFMWVILSVLLSTDLANGIECLLWRQDNFYRCTLIAGSLLVCPPKTRSSVSVTHAASMRPDGDLGRSAEYQLCSCVPTPELACPASPAVPLHRPRCCTAISSPISLSAISQIFLAR